VYIHYEENPTFTIPTNNIYTYNYSVDCTDSGTLTQDGLTEDFTCNYATSGAKTIVITGVFPSIYFNNEGDKDSLIEIMQWGTGEWQSMENAFWGANSFQITATDKPDLSKVFNMSSMFEGTNINEDIGDWNVSNVTNMDSLFAHTRAFNKDISNWDVSSVTNMHAMFLVTHDFDQPLNSWNVSNVTDMSYIFASTTSFNQDINNWNVSNVTSMDYMFGNARVFNQAINDWNVSKVTNMDYMFGNTSVFNQPIGSWNVSNVTSMYAMFRDTDVFNQPIGSWNVSEVKNMTQMFSGATAFNQDISDWNVSKVTYMSSMFSSSNFNQPIGKWDVSGVKLMRYMFYSSPFNQDIAEWDVSGAEDMSHMFLYARDFNQDIGDWNVSNAYKSQVGMLGMFYGATAFNQDIADWDVSNVTEMTDMFKEAHPMSISNYDNLLYSWEKLNLQSNVDFHAGIDSHYCQNEWSKEYIEDEYNWAITDGGYLCDFHMITENAVSVKSGEKYVIDVNANIDEGEDTYHDIVGGADQDKFTMNLYGELEFKVAPNASNPTDRNTDNVYRVQVDATNPGYPADYQTIKVTVESNGNVALVPVISYLLN